jgi:hypothetical protein
MKPQDRVSRFTQLVIDLTIKELTANLETRVSEVPIAEHNYQVTFNDRNAPKTCYICCPLRAYINYAIDEIRHFSGNSVIRFAMTQLIKACAPLVRASGMDHQVQLNNWLLSTNPMPPISDADAIRGTLTKLHLDRAIVIRSLSEIADTATITALCKSGFRMLPARVVYIAAALAGPAHQII